VEFDGVKPDYITVEKIVQQMAELGINMKNRLTILRIYDQGIYGQ